MSSIRDREDPEQKEKDAKGSQRSSIFSAKKRPFSQYLLFFMILLTLGMAIGITYVDYFRAEATLRENVKTLQDLTEHDLVEAVHLVDSGFKLFDNSLNRQMETGFELLLAEYERAGSDPSKMDLSSVKEDLGGEMDVYLINESLTIEYSTFPPDLGLDFNQYPSSADYFRRIFQKEGFFADRVVRELNTGNLRKFAYMPTPDHRYIFELGLSFNAFPERTRPTIDYTGSIERIARQNPYLTRVRMFDTNFHLIGNTSYYPTPDEHRILERMIAERGVIEFISPDSGILTRYLFVDLYDEDYASDTSWILELTYDTTGIQADLNELLAFHAMVAILAVIAAAIFAGIASKYLSIPIQTIVSDIDRISHGDLDHKISPSYTLEFTRIENSINSMVETLKGSIHQLQISQNALLRSEQRYRTVVESQTEMIVRYHPDGTLVFTNEAYCNYFGLPCDRIIGQKFRPSIPPEDAEKVSLHFRQFSQKTPSGSIEHRVILRSGEIRWLQWNDLALFDPDGNVVEYQSVGRDITERKKVDMALAESEKKYRDLAGLLPQVVFESDRVGNVLFANKHAPQLMGYSLDEIYDGRDIFSFIDPAERESAKNKIADVLSGNRTDGTPYTVIRKDGSRLRTMVYTAPSIREGNVVGIRGILVDITKLKEIEDELRRLNEELEQRVLERTRDLEVANRELEAFSYSVSHDLRAPLRAINGFSFMLQSSLPKDISEESLQHLERIRYNTHYMSQLIEAILNFSRMSRQPLNTQKIYPSQVVRDVMEDLQDLVRDRKIETTTGDLPPFDGDPALIRQVFLNLISNSLKFTRSRNPAVIEIGSRMEGYQRVYYVRDNGVGFDMKYVEKLFQVFQRLHDSREYEGTGIGLAISQRIIQRHGGRIWAESRPGEGSTFYFTVGEGAHRPKNGDRDDPIG